MDVLFALPDQNQWENCCSSSLVRNDEEDDGIVAVAVADADTATAIFVAIVDASGDGFIGGNFKYSTSSSW